jgi:hypothetical protein
MPSFEKTSFKEIDSSHTHEQRGIKSTFQVDLNDDKLILNTEKSETVSRTYTRKSTGEITIEERIDDDATTYGGRFSGTALLGDLHGETLESTSSESRQFLFGKPGKTRAFITVDNAGMHIEMSYPKTGKIDTVDVGFNPSFEINLPIINSLVFGRMDVEKGNLFYTNQEIDIEDPSGDTLATYSTCEKQDPEWIRDISGDYEGKASIYPFISLSGAYKTLPSFFNWLSLSSGMNYGFKTSFRHGKHYGDVELLRTHYHMKVLSFTLFNFNSTSLLVAQNNQFRDDKIGQVVNIEHDKKFGKLGDAFITQQYIPNHSLEFNIHISPKGSVRNIEAFITKKDTDSDKLIMETVFLGTSKLSFFGKNISDRKLGVVGLNHLTRADTQAHFDKKFWEHVKADEEHNRIVDYVADELTVNDLEPDSSIILS